MKTWSLAVVAASVVASTPSAADEYASAPRLTLGESVERRTQGGERCVYAFEAKAGQKIGVRVASDGALTFRVEQDTLFGSVGVRLHSDWGVNGFTAESSGNHYLVIDTEGAGRMTVFVADVDPAVRFNGILGLGVGADDDTQVDFVGNVALGVGHGSVDLVAGIAGGALAPRLGLTLGLGLRLFQEPMSRPFFRITLGGGYLHDFEFPDRVSPYGFAGRLDWMLDAELTNAFFNVDTNDSENFGGVGMTLYFELQYQMDGFVRGGVGFGIGF